MNCIIIDDENHCIQSLTKLIEKSSAKLKFSGPALIQQKHLTRSCS